MSSIDFMIRPPLSTIVILLTTLGVAIFMLVAARRFTDQGKFLRYRKEIAEWNELGIRAEAMFLRARVTKEDFDDRLTLEYVRRRRIIQTMKKLMVIHKIKVCLAIIVPSLIVFLILSSFPQLF